MSPARPPTGPVGTHPRQRQRPEIRRRMLLDAARAVIAERGLHATTIRDVAAAGGVAVGTVTYHFTGIAEVLAGVLDSEMATYSAPIWARAAQAPTGLNGISLLIDGLVGDGRRAVEHWKLWLDFWALAAHYPQYAQWQSRVYRDLHALTAGLLARGQRDGSLRSADPDAAAVELVAMLDGLVVQAYLPGARLSPTRARHILHQYVRATLAGSSPGHDAPNDEQPIDEQPGDAQPGDAQPGDAQPGDAQPGDAQPGDAQPGDDAAAGGPAE